MVYTRGEVRGMKKEIILMFLLVTVLAFGRTSGTSENQPLLLRKSTFWVR